MSTTPQLAGEGNQGFGLGDSVYNRLLKERIIWLGSEVRDENSNIICAQLMLLAAGDPDKDIFLYINSPGGSITAGMAIYDTMQYIKCPVSTICAGQAASMAAILLAGGEKGKRTSLPNSRIMIHQPLGGARGQATDIEIQAKEILRMRSLLNDILVQHSGQKLDRIEQDTDRDFFMSPKEALEYGLIDRIIEKR